MQKQLPTSRPLPRTGQPRLLPICYFCLKQGGGPAPPGPGSTPPDPAWQTSAGDHPTEWKYTSETVRIDIWVCLEAQTRLLEGLVEQLVAWASELARNCQKLPVPFHVGFTGPAGLSCSSVVSLGVINNLWTAPPA